MFVTALPAKQINSGNDIGANTIARGIQRVRKITSQEIAISSLFEIEWYVCEVDLREVKATKVVYEAIKLSKTAGMLKVNFISLPEIFLN